jgi:hypothetical protein
MANKRERFMNRCREAPKREEARINSVLEALQADSYHAPSSPAAMTRAQFLELAHGPHDLRRAGEEARINYVLAKLKADSDPTKHPDDSMNIRDFNALISFEDEDHRSPATLRPPLFDGKAVEDPESVQKARKGVFQKFKDGLLNNWRGGAVPQTERWRMRVATVDSTGLS